MEERLRIAIDGPAGAGKSTVAKAIAKRLGIRYLDTGAMYRAMALYAEQMGVAPTDGDAMAGIVDGADITVRFDEMGQKVFLNGEDVTDRLRTSALAMGASAVGVHPCVRKKLAALQRKVGDDYAVVMDGRDITTNVLPDTKYKFYVTASPEVRAARRLNELRERGDTTATMEAVLADILRRDHNDSTRAYMPLTVAPDALLIDTSELSIAEATEAVIRAVNDRRQGA